MRKPIDNTITLENSLHIPISVTLTERVTFFIIRGSISFADAMNQIQNAEAVYSADNIEVKDCRKTFTRVIRIDVNEAATEDQAPPDFDFYGGDFVIVRVDGGYEGYVFLPYLNLFYRVVDNDEHIANKWCLLPHPPRCIAALHHLCSQLILINQDTSENELFEELQNLHKLANAWITPSVPDMFDWDQEAKKLLDINVVPKIKTFTVNSSHRRIRLD